MPRVPACTWLGTCGYWFTQNTAFLLWLHTVTVGHRSRPTLLRSNRLRSIGCSPGSPGGRCAPMTVPQRSKTKLRVVCSFPCPLPTSLQRTPGATCHVRVSVTRNRTLLGKLGREHPAAGCSLLPTTRSSMCMVLQLPPVKYPNGWEENPLNSATKRHKVSPELLVAVSLSPALAVGTLQCQVSAMCWAWRCGEDTRPGGDNTPPKGQRQQGCPKAPGSRQGRGLCLWCCGRPSLCPEPLPPCTPQPRQLGPDRGVS